jgi:Inner membrane protein YgaP-like, transmembrane domain
MKKNMGTVDRIVRLLLVTVFAILYFGGFVSGTVGLILVVLAGVFLLTSLVSFCPIYALFRLNTSLPHKA